MGKIGVEEILEDLIPKKTPTVQDVTNNSGEGEDEEAIDVGLGAEQQEVESKLKLLCPQKKSWINSWNNTWQIQSRI